LSTFEKIKINPDVINEYAEIKEDPEDSEETLKGLERKADKIRNRIMRLTETLAEGSNASKYIIAQIEKEDLSLEAIQREINILRSEKRKAKVSKASVLDRAKKIKKLMSNLSELSAEDKNAIAREVLQECTWDGETLHIKM
ncbi:MAG: hypothetical protein K5644_01850, partial [Lachnospiraceae bacterium]|nr:hypothetical protein [Lachnospiraceae bacterium]